MQIYTGSSRIGANCLRTEIFLLGLIPTSLLFCVQLVYLASLSLLMTYLIDSNDADHARIRRTVAHAFSENALQEQEPLLTPYFDLLVEKLKSKIEGSEQGVVDMTHWYNFVSFDVVSDLVVGESLQLLQNESFDYWTNTIFKGIKMLRYIRVVHAYPVLWWLFSLLFMIPALNEARARPMQSAIDRAEKRLETKTARKDIMSYVSAPMLPFL